MARLSPIPDEKLRDLELEYEIVRAEIRLGRADATERARLETALARMRKARQEASHTPSDSQRGRTMV